MQEIFFTNVRKHRINYKANRFFCLFSDIQLMIHLVINIPVVNSGNPDGHYAGCTMYTLHIASEAEDAQK